MAAFKIILLIFVVGLFIYACLSFAFAIYKKVKLKREEKLKAADKPDVDSNNDIEDVNNIQN